jgi:dihydrofolate synthase/folylpolyglutamate synthase
MSHSTLNDWLGYIERLHPKAIAMGLERVARVRDAMNAALGGAPAMAVPVITVGGTNGKGSTCAMLESMLRAAGYRTGLYTSPHLLRYNERVRIAGLEAGDAELCAAFDRVEEARKATAGGPVTLTYFEFGTLAAWDLFARAGLDVVILEVGLGGRLDAVNVFDADCAVLTSVDIDHRDYLGDTREAIGAEKAGIFRAGRPAIVGDPQPPASVFEQARRIGADLQCIGRDFGFQGDRQQWQFWGKAGKRPTLAYPSLRGANQLLNASAALAALDSLADRLPVGMNHIRLGLATVELPGRFQVLAGRPTVILDVAHNPHAAAVLAENLFNMGFFPETHAVFGMLGDKDIAGVCRALRGRISFWHVATLSGPRGTSAGTLAAAIAESGAGGTVVQHATPQLAYAAARSATNENDRIVAFGSFLTVAEVMKAIAQENQGHSAG